jgi:SAM-dependent methyltransferase
MSVMNDWYVSWFSTKEYLDLYKHRDENDAKRALDLIFKHVRIPKNSSILDLACGNGRHSLLLAKRGFNVTGIDLSRYLISEAKKKGYKLEAGSVKYEVKDMRNFSYPGQFDLVVNLFTSFGYFEHDSENDKVIECAAKSLKKPGYLVIDYLNTCFLKKNLNPYNISKDKNRAIIQVRSISDTCVMKDIHFIFRNRAGYKFKKFHERIKLYSLSDFEKMLKRNGIEIIKVFGDYNEEKFEQEKSPRLIIIGKKGSD